MLRKKISYRDVFAAVAPYSVGELSNLFKSRLFGKNINIEEFKREFDARKDFLIDMDSFVVLSNCVEMNYAYISESCKNVIGYSNQDWINGGVKFLISNFCQADYTIQKRMLDVIKQHQDNCVLKEKALFIYETTFRFYHKGGYFKWLLGRLVFNTHNKMGKPLLAANIMSDIDRFKKDDYQWLKIYRIDPESGEYTLDYKFGGFPEGMDLLTPLDLEILKLLAEGGTNKSIADQLNYKESTIKDYRKKMLKKTWCSNTTELLYHALRNELI